MPEILSSDGTPTANDFVGAKGTPLIVDTDTGKGYVLIDSTVTLLGNDAHSVVATASLPAAAAAQNGRIIIEDAGAGDRNLIVYAGGQRFRIDGGAAF
jgi:hypothetical protein